MKPQPIASLRRFCEDILFCSAAYEPVESIPQIYLLYPNLVLVFRGIYIQQQHNTFTAYNAEIYNNCKS